MTAHKSQKHRGFTLVELVTVIVVLGVVSVGIFGFIRTGVDIYSDVTQRVQLLNDSRFVIERINRELRGAIPNSIRVASTTDNTIQCIEFVPSEWVAFYTSLSVKPDITNNAVVVEFFDNEIDFVLSVGDFAIVYPLNNIDLYDLTKNRRQEITACTNEKNNCSMQDATGTVKLTVTNRFEAHSPASRLYIANKAVSYCVRDNDNTIYRHQNIINTNQEVYLTGGVLMAENVVNNLADTSLDKPFTVYDAALNRNGLVNILLAFEQDDEIINYNSEVHIANVP